MACKQFFDLSNGIKIPALGYGTWQATDKELEDAVEAALEAGYRHIDTAHAYQNEAVIGKVLKRWFDAGKLQRKDIFLVTKLPPGGNYPEGVQKYLQKSLDLLQVDYVDLYLVHLPFRLRDVDGDILPHKPNGDIDMIVEVDHIGIWKELEKLLEEGKTKSIGISNFNEKQIKRILEHCKIPPAVLQIELHAYFQQKELVDFCKKNHIVVTAYSPLGSPGLGKFVAQFGQKIDLPDILGNPVVKEIAKKYNKAVAQILLRHIIQRGIVAIPKSTNPVRLKQNIDIFDFKLDADDMSKMNSLDQGPVARILSFAAFKGIDKHPEYPF